MPSKSQVPAKRGPKPRPWATNRIPLTPELDAMLNHLVTVSGISRAAIVRDALAKYGEDVGYFPPGTAQSITPTKTSGPTAALRKDVH